ncbi:MAG: desulfoferrodoxin family protein, partial [Beduini sp.]
HIKMHLHNLCPNYGVHFKVYRKDLKAGDKPEASFNLNGYTGMVEVYEFCNLHGLWKKEVEVK